MIFRPTVPSNRQTEVWGGSWAASLICPHAGNLANAVEHELWAWRGAGLHLLGNGIWLLADHLLCTRLQSAPSFYQAMCKDATYLRYMLYSLCCYTMGGTAEVLPFLTHKQEEKNMIALLLVLLLKLPMGCWFSQGIKCMIYTSSPRQPWQQSAVHSTPSKSCPILVSLLFLLISYATSQ